MKLVLNIPDSIVVNEHEVKTVLAARFYEIGKLSIGQAAELAGFSKRTFMELLGSLNVSIFNSTENDIENDIANAYHYHL